MANYSILGSTGNLANLKLFVHADHLAMLPKSDDGWKNVEYSFWPSEQSPDGLQLTFTSDEHEPYRSVSVALPKEADALECISTRQIFAVSQKRLVALHRYCVRRYGMALIERGYEAGSTAGGGRIMEVTVDEQKCRIRAEPLFDFMKAVLLYDKRKTLDECGKQFRDKTQRQLRLLLIHARLDSSKVVAIEANMYSKHRGNLLDYYHATKLSPAGIVQNYAGSATPRPIAPRPPVAVAPPPPANAGLFSANVQTVNMNLNGRFVIRPSVGGLAFVNLAEDEQPNPRVPLELRQVRLPAQQRGVLAPPSPQTIVIQQNRQPQAQPQTRIDQTIEQSLQQQSIARVTSSPEVPPAQPQPGNTAANGEHLRGISVWQVRNDGAIQPEVQLIHQTENSSQQSTDEVTVTTVTSEAGNARNTESVVRVPPMPRVQSSVNTPCPFCTMRFDVRSDVFYLHVALVHIPRLINDVQSKVRCGINNCEIEYADRVEQLQGCVCISQVVRFRKCQVLFICEKATFLMDAFFLQNS